MQAYLYQPYNYRIKDQKQKKQKPYTNTEKTILKQLS